MQRSSPLRWLVTNKGEMEIQVCDAGRARWRWGCFSGRSPASCPFPVPSSYPQRLLSTTHIAGVKGSSEEVDEFGLVLKFTWGNTQLQPETDTHTALLCCSPSILSPRSGKVHTPHLWSHTDLMNASTERGAKKEGLAVPWMASSTPSQEAAWLQAHFSGIPGRSASWPAKLLPETKLLPSKDLPYPQGKGRKEGQTSVGHLSTCQTYLIRAAVK